MSDIELVIKIDEEKLNIIKNKTYCGIYDPDLYKAIENGIVLPKGHGRLIDADETVQRLCGLSCGCTVEECGYEVPCFSVRRINSAPTIIDKEQKS